MESKLEEINIVAFVLSGIGILICQIIKKRILKYSKYFFRDTVKVISPAEVGKYYMLDKVNSSGPNKNLSDFKYMVTGIIKREDEFSYITLKKTENNFKLYDIPNMQTSNAFHNVSVYLKNPYLLPDTVSLYNLRYGSLESYKTYLNIWFFSLTHILTLGYPRKFYSHDYLIYDDMVTIYGTAKHNKNLNTYYFNPEIISQGNKLTLSYNHKKNWKIINSIQQPLCFIFFFIVTISGLKFLLQYLGCYFGSKNQIRTLITQTKAAASNYKENCMKCNRYYKNVISLDCNHFVYCLSCFENYRRVCPLCRTRVNQFNILIDRVNK